MLHVLLALVLVCGVDKDMCAKAVEKINNIVRDYLPGEIFAGKVVRILDFGAFVEIAPGRDGMVHVSELAPYRVSKPGDFMNIGDEVTVKIKEIDEQGRVNLTMKGLAENEHVWKEEKGTSNGDDFGGGRGFGGGGRFNNSRGNDRGGDRGRFRR